MTTDPTTEHAANEDELRTSIESMLDDEIHRDGPLDPAWLATWVMDLVAPHVATRVAAARAEALRGAADALEGGLGLPGTPKTLWEFRVWLRARAVVSREPGEGDQP